MARTQTMVQLSDDLVTLLDDEARAQGLSRSALIRTILAAHLEEQSRASIGRQIAEGYRRVPPGHPDEWGDLATQTDRANADVLLRLDSEERSSGNGPW